jgi:hypothetical protein
MVSIVRHVNLLFLPIWGLSGMNHKLLRE